MNAARVRMSPELLFSVIPFPAGTRISAARYREDIRAIEFVMEHPQLPLSPDGEPPPLAEPRFRKEGHEPVFVDWGLTE